MVWTAATANCAKLRMPVGLPPDPALQMPPRAWTRSWREQLATSSCMRNKERPYTLHACVAEAGPAGGTGQTMFVACRCVVRRGEGGAAQPAHVALRRPELKRDGEHAEADPGLGGGDCARGGGGAALALKCSPRLTALDSDWGLGKRANKSRGKEVHQINGPKIPQEQ